MQSRIIGFEIIKSNKNGYLIKNALMAVFTIFGFQNKILSLGVDNESNNTKSIDLRADVLISILKIFFIFDVCVIYSTVQAGIETLFYIVSPVRKATRWIRRTNCNRLSFKEAL